MSLPRIDMTGKKVGKWNVIKFAGIDKSNFAMWNCVCDCGTEQLVRGVSLRNGNSTQCFKHRIKHGMHKSPTYISYHSMVSRCNKPSDIEYFRYGGKGISVCEQWMGKHGFECFIKDKGIRPNGTTLDRFPDKNGNYTPENTRWATWKEQGRNRNGVKLSMGKALEIKNKYASHHFLQRELAEEYNVCRTLIQKIVAGKVWS